MKKMLLVITTAIFLLLPSLVFADGAIFPQPGYWITEAEQKAVIVYENNIETLILSITFKGDPKNFAWVIPVPNRPTVDKSSDELFTALEELTRYKETITPDILSLPWGGAEIPGAAKRVTVLETKKVDIYDITILESTDAEALAKWLKENGYKYPEKASYILDEYIQNKWYFVAVKIDPEKILGAEGKLASGHATPIKIVFNSDKIIYPLKISSLMSTEINKECTSNKDCKNLICTQVVGQDTPCCINGRCICGPKDCKSPLPLIKEKTRVKSKASGIYSSENNQSVSIMLYVFADHKKTVPGFETFYANWIKPDKIKKLAYDSNGKPWYEANKTFYLTKLYRNMLFSEMTEDLILRDAEDNVPVGIGMLAWQKVLLIILYALLFLMIWIISPLGLAFIILSIVQFVIKNKIVRIIFWILQSFLLVLSLIITLLLGITYFSGSFSEGYYYTNIASMLLTSKINLLAAFCSSVFMVAVMITVMIIQEIWQRKRRESTIK